LPDRKKNLINPSHLQVFEFKNIPVDFLDILCRIYYCPPALLALYSLWAEYRKNPNNQVSPLLLEFV
jgi:hypothetical protein